DSPREFALDPLVIGPAGLALAGAIVLLRRGNPLPFLVALPYAALLVVFNAKYEVIPNARFLTPLAPLVFASSGALISAARARSARRPARRPARARHSARWRREPVRPAAAGCRPGRPDPRNTALARRGDPTRPGAGAAPLLDLPRRPAQHPSGDARAE